jgi:glycosyltransferase involved in cell wall biosynthesis
MNRRVRVLHFRREVPTGGGPETLLIGVGRCRDRENFVTEMAVFGPCENHTSPFIDAVRETGVTVHIIPVRGKFDFSAVRRLASILDERSIDILHTHDHRTNLVGYLAIRRRPTRIVCTLHQPLRRHWWIRHFEILDDHLVRRFDRILPVAEAIRQEVIAKKSSLADRTMTVLNGVDLSHYDRVIDRNLVRKELNIPDDHVLCATIGRLSDDKGIPDLLTAAKSVIQSRDDVHWLIAGKGPLAEAMRRRNAELGLENRVRFLGFRTDVPELLAAADMLVVASTSEGCSVVILEAMGSGLAVVATDVGGSAEVVVDGVTGYVVSPRRPAELAAAVTKLVESRETRYEMGRRARERAYETFSEQRMVGRFESIYRQLLSGSD